MAGLSFPVQQVVADVPQSPELPQGVEGNPNAPICMPREQLIDQIKQSSKVVPVFVALVPSKGVALEVWRSTVDEKWVEFISRPDNISCVILQGKVFGFANPSEPEEPKTTTDEHGHVRPYYNPEKPKL
jgi:hypothetical protein